jgi:hypothetical protein
VDRAAVVAATPRGVAALPLKVEDEAIAVQLGLNHVFALSYHFTVNGRGGMEMG